MVIGEKPGRNSPISGVIEDVNTELLCTMKVIPAPTRMARYPVNQAKGKGKSRRKRDLSQAF